jgi:uncharacterized protein (TIGR02996 family)
MNERNAFLNALTDNEDDTSTRLVYADWLDEHGEHEEADRQRQWPAAKEWLVRFCRDHNHQYSFEQVISCEELIELGRQAVGEATESGLGFDCGTNETMRDALYANCREFWKNWSVVTGIPVPLDVEVKSRFGCSC